MTAATEGIETVIVGAGQAGLHYDSLRLYSPARLAGLPGMSFPGPAWTFPTKDQMADYLEEYAAQCGLPIRGGGVVPSAPGLYLSGLAFQYAFSSMLILGASRDAEYVANQIAAHAD